MIRKLALTLQIPFLIIALLALDGCITDPTQETGFVQAGGRWIKRDTSLVYLELKVPPKGTSTLRVRYLELLDSGIVEGEVVFDLPAAMHCGEQIFRSSDSLYAFSYVTRRADVNTAGVCDSAAKRVHAGFFASGVYTPATAVDTVALLALLRASGAEVEPGITVEQTPYYDKLCVEGHGCLYP